MADTSSSTTSQQSSAKEAALQKVASETPRSRDGIADWKWKGSLAAVMLTTVINGYDVSNVANIQPRLYEAFGDIALLPWIGLSFSLAVFAFLSFSRKIIYCFDMQWIYIVSVVVFMAGAAVAGAAHNLATVIVGRTIMGVGGSVIYQSNLTFVAVFATPAETPRLFGLLGALWAVGLVIGGPIGSALASNPNTTWRWAFYMNLPWAGLVLVIAFICMPSKYLGPDIPVWSRIARIDPIGITMNIAVPALFSIALEFSGPVWDWGSGASIAVWVVFGVLLIGWIVQQYWCIGTTPDQRAVPLHLFRRLDLVPLWIASGCAGASYAGTLYYTPLFFAFARGHSALQQTVRLLPFVIVFIAVVLLVGALLPLFGRYNLIYIIAGLATVAGAGAMAATLSPDVPESQVMGLEALIGVGLGCSYQHGVGISNVINKDPRDKVDSVVMFNLAQMGGITVILSIAGSIFQNVGFHLLKEAIGGNGYSEDDLRQALAGVSSTVWESDDPDVLARGVQAVSDALAREYYLIVAGGALCFTAMAFLYQMLGSKIWPPRDTKPDLAGQTLLITGANPGLGYEPVIKFKGEEAKRAILAQIPQSNATIEVYPLDMLDYSTIESFASRVNQEVERRDYVVLNAGISPYAYKKSAYGFESGIQVNLVSTTLLSLLLLPKLLASKTDTFTPVLELVGSGTHPRMPQLLPETDNTEKNILEVYNSEASFRTFGFIPQYSLTKLFLMYVQWHLVKLVDDKVSGSPRVHVIVVGPGPTQSGLGRDFQEQSSLGVRIAVHTMILLTKTAEQGAHTYLSGLMLGEKGHGQFWQWDSVNRC
ncbi:major facilitator superfamily domain-containing protein [Aspergillus minisclerotigenes]|uniref:Major facilitator superfamily domain-containing protein n=1 Tax=Aspergillus minisclerotigenes TaxID=656917 RepID=A0A5N6JE65_9EURO|nr:major facilitator superfamily domain-containing protein [Aspergillus minisclerotigenes]